MIGFGLRGLFTLKHFRSGQLIAERAFPNAVVDQGANLLLETMFRGAAQRNWFIGLIAGGGVTLSNADTMASHAGWTELASYSEAARQQWVANNPSATRRLGNAGPDAGVYHFPGAATLAGAFLTDNATKGGAAGILFCTAMVTSLSLAPGDTVMMGYQMQIS